jgi:mitochondrial distribution and morphology protein 12
MSIELEWDKLDLSLAQSLVDMLNRQLVATQRPSFIGPVEVISLDFGSNAPDVELVGLRDIYRDFLEDDEEEEEVDKGPVKVTEGAEDDDDGFEWVSRKAARKEEKLAYDRLPLPAHAQYARMDMFASPALPSHLDIWNPGLPGIPQYRPAYKRTSWPGTPLYQSQLSPGLASLNDEPPLSAPPTDLHPLSSQQDLPPVLDAPSAAQDGQIPDPDSVDTPSPPAATPQPQTHPNLQLHFHINWQSNLKITLTTSLLINYPSPMFMSLPIKLSIIGLIFSGEIAVAYEGERKRVHLCILDDLDPYGPVGDRPKLSGTGTAVETIPPELNDDDLLLGLSGVPSRPPKPLPIGQRLLPSIFIESEIGQADKHVLKNVSRVERFIQDVIRKTVEEELVFPNFHTLVMG